jgi:hypothetical protein
MAYLNDGSIGNWACYLFADGSLACCVQLHQRGPEHRSGRIATRGFESPEEAFHYLHVTLGQPLDNMRFFVSSPEQFYLTVCLAGPKLPLNENMIVKGLTPIEFHML